jgi:hypothetical protein
MKRKAEHAVAKRYHELRKQIAGRTGLADDSPRLDYLTLLALQIDRVKLRLINGDDTVTSAELLALQGVIEQVSPEPVHGVNIQVCRKLHGVCKFCGKLNELDIDVPPPGVPPEPPPFVPPDPLLLPAPSINGGGND